MKKYIALTALLAAGSAFANAEGLTDGLVAYWNFDNSSSSYTSYTGFTGGGVTTGLTADNFRSDGGLGNTGYIVSHRDGGNMDFYNDLSGANISTSAFTISFKVKAATADYRSLISFNIGSLGQVNLQTENPGQGNDVWLYGTEIEITDDAARGAIKGTDDWASIVICGNGETITVMVNSCSGVATYTPVLDEKLSNLQLGSQWGDGGRRVEASFDDFAIWNRALNTSELTALSNGTVRADGTPIPEPSTFGLLAGLGALALVGTRRRRK